MGACHTFYDELRFDVRDPHQTHVYCYIRAEGDCPHMIQGWHHKAFPNTIPTLAIFNTMFQGENPDDPIMWPLKAPDSPERNATLDEVSKVVGDEAMNRSGTSHSAPIFELARKIEGMKS